MKTDNLIEIKTFGFAIRIVRLSQYLKQSKNEAVLSKQLLRSGTSIGANVNEGLQGVSRRDFAMKLSIALKEAQECSYWLKLLNATEYNSHEEFESIHNDNIEIIKILTSILKSTRTSSP